MLSGALSSNTSLPFNGSDWRIVGILFSLAYVLSILYVRYSIFCKYTIGHFPFLVYPSSQSPLPPQSIRVQLCSLYALTDDESLVLWFCIRSTRWVRFSGNL